jgi:antitoxin MazE
MIAKVQKWGNSLAVRIPRSFAEDTHLTSGKTVTMAVQDGQIVIAPTKHKEYKLNDLLRGITTHNRHSEVETGNPAGHEAW